MMKVWNGQAVVGRRFSKYVYTKVMDIRVFKEDVIDVLSMVVAQGTTGFISSPLRQRRELVGSLL